MLTVDSKFVGTTIIKAFVVNYIHNTRILFSTYIITESLTVLHCPGVEDVVHGHHRHVLLAGGVGAVRQGLGALVFYVVYISPKHSGD